MNKKAFVLILGIAFAMLIPVTMSLSTLVDAHADDDAATNSALVGLWASAWGQNEGEPVRFYYFHDKGGIGLYRYGRIGLNKTNSYLWSSSNDDLSLTFKKSGEKVTSKFVIIEDEGERFLVLSNDPRDGKGTRYRYVPPPPLGTVDDETAFQGLVENARDLASVQSDERSDHPFARMWTHARPYATGGMGFSIYQFKPPALDGRGVGWYHEGDFDDWSTETLVYRRSADGIELIFPVRHERALSPLIVGKGNNTPVIDVLRDPRNFWHRRIYADGGRSFSITNDDVIRASEEIVDVTGPVPFDLALIKPSRADSAR